MEILIGLIVLGFVGWYFWPKAQKIADVNHDGKVDSADLKEAIKVVETKVEEKAKAEASKIVEAAKVVETKVEEAVKCGCGRSPTGFCVGLHLLSEEEWKKAQAAETKVVEEVTKVETAVKATATKAATKVKAAAKTTAKEAKAVKAKVAAKTTKKTKV